MQRQCIDPTPGHHCRSTALLSLILEIWQRVDCLSLCNFNRIVETSFCRDSMKSFLGTGLRASSGPFRYHRVEYHKLPELEHPHALTRFQPNFSSSPLSRFRTFLVHDCPWPPSSSPRMAPSNDSAHQYKAIDQVENAAFGEFEESSESLNSVTKGTKSFVRYSGRYSSVLTILNCTIFSCSVLLFALSYHSPQRNPASHHSSYSALKETSFYCKTPFSPLAHSS